ncbi:MAG: thioredoxin TrxC [Candidatus Thiodiazotropha taylori]|nr:thioredoxin TrxC [Candidatus Thiodiazotropha taylori]MCG7958751.1 thioredoxin TrxC [Candidatus Thiodiazotropha taylori]MCG8082187.1 thioredoxin TrxC [Candidatus Thiodiazotropha taylori]MCG8084302.1 thioredoxin TrxC [Candidatus Thiodiazotropha taylori]MCG8088165.1 thioredoxin TrxC [Candidatus Thiodiazotropha taylori]
MSDFTHLVCPHCDGINRLPAGRSAEQAKCGKCHQPLFSGQPLSLDEGRFIRHLQKSDLPLLVDFWAPWCGPCRMMAPAFEAAAKELEPHIRLIKVNTEEAQRLGAQYAIRSIPTLMLIHQGRELARQAGAMDRAGIIGWARRELPGS